MCGESFKPTAKKLRSVSIAILLVILSISFIVMVLEIGVRLLKSQKTFSVTVNAWDPYMGTRHIPNEKGFIVCPEYSIDLIINSKGLRDREFPYDKPDSVKRILCLGDSYTCGYGVHAEETFPKVLERCLNERMQPGCHWEVINAGVGSTGTAHQLAYFTIEGYKFDSDMVILCFCPANDYQDNVTSRLYSIENGSLVKHDAVKTSARKIQRFVKWIPFYRSLFARSHLFNFLKYRITLLHYKHLYSKSEQTRKQGSSGTSIFEELTKKLVERLKHECTERECPLVMVFIQTPEVGNLPRLTGNLINFANQTGIPCLDLEPYFQEETEQNIQACYPTEGHWNNTGHRLAALTIFKYLLDNKLLDCGPTPVLDSNTHHSTSP